MPSILAVARDYRAQLLARDTQAARDLIAAYRVIWQAIQRDLAALTRQMADAQARGEPITRSWLYREQRLQRFQAQVAQQVARFAESAGGTITAAQAEALALARQQAAALLPTVTAGFTTLPANAVTETVGVLGDGSPLRSLLDQLGPDASTSARDALLRAVALGKGPAATARDLRTALGGNLARALAISRTETLRAYRNAALDTYRANGDVLNGWRWLASLDRRCCAFCVSMNGTFHRLSEPFASHVNCRCSPVPDTKSYADLGIDGVAETPLVIEDGAAWFDRQSAADQQFILGPSKYRAFKDGALSLADLRGFTDDPDWGPVGYERSLRDVLGQSGAQRYLVG